MQKSFFIAAMASTTLAIAACSPAADDTAEVAVDGAGDASSDMVDAQTVGADAVLDANVATVEQLSGVEGVSPELAQAIVDGRPYASIVDLNAALVETLASGEAMAVMSRVFVPVDLNDATREQIALIPGMTDRMIGEFLEYQPYDDMAEFDREIGKYVDEAEVARFRNYVTL